MIKGYSALNFLLFFSTKFLLFSFFKDDGEYINRKEELLDLVKDKNSPWYINYDWSSEANKIRELYISEINSINLDNIEKYFKTLRLIDKNVTLIFFLIIPYRLV